MIVSKKSILIIGDCQFEREVYTRALPDFELIFIEEHQRALQEIQNREFSLFIIHQILDAKAVLSFLSQIFKLTSSNVPTILIINQGDEKVAVEAMKEGVSDYLTHEELIPPILTMAINRAMEHKKWERVYREVHQGGDKIYFYKRAREEIKRAKRYEFPLTMVLLYVDHFEDLIHYYGKEGGDWLAGELGQLIKHDLRSSDLIAHLEDNQFALLLPHTNLNDSQIVCKRMIHRIREHPFTYQEKNILISLRGVHAALNQKVENLDLLINQMITFLKTQQQEETLIIYEGEEKNCTS